MSGTNNALESNVEMMIKQNIKLNIGFGGKLHTQYLYKVGKGLLPVNGEPFDFWYMTKEMKLFCFDCKQSKRNRINIDKKELKQHKNLTYVNNLNDNCFGFFLIHWIHSNKYKIITVEETNDILKTRKSFKESDGKLIKFENLFILRKDNFYE